jgi:hypothetical protein
MEVSGVVNGGVVMVGRAGGLSADALAQAVNRWEDAGRRLVRIAGVLQANAGRVRPLALGVEHLVGGSATARDKEMAGLLKQGADELTRTAATAHEAGQRARRLAAQVHAEVQELRRQQSSPPGAR